MKQKQIYKSLLIAFTVLTSALMTGCGTNTVKKVKNGTELTSFNSEVQTEAVSAEEQAVPVAEDKRVHVSAAGDNLIHYSVYKNAEAYAVNGENYNFAPLYENVRSIIEGADVAILNQETVISQSNACLLYTSPSPRDCS